MATTYALCSFPSVKSELAHPPEALDPARMSAAAQEATALADSAWLAEDEDAWGHAERLLYTIHAANGFVGPLLPGVVGVIWSTLMNRKLASLLGDEEELSPAEMTARLKAMLQAADAQDNSAIAAFASAPDLRPITLYTKNWYCSAHGFTHQLVALVQRCNGRKGFGPAFQATLAHLTREGVPVPPRSLRERLPRELGTSYTPEGALADPDHLTEAFSLQNVRTGLASLADPSYALGSFYSIEGADADHAKEFLGALLRCELTPRERGRIVTGARLQLGARHAMFDWLLQVSSVP